LYSSIHIALGASLSVFLCYATFIHIPTSNYPIFVFTSTIFVYSLHKLFGIGKVKKFENEGRFAIIKKYKSHILIYAVLGGLSTIYFFYTLDLQIQLLLFLPGIISFLYVIPFFSNKKRLRDFDFIKIFLISITWGLIIGIIPYLETGYAIDGKGILYFCEKVLFIFSITLPFDVRDIQIDKQNQVKTLPSIIGEKKSYILSYVVLGICIAIVFTLFLMGVYTLSLFIAISIGYLITLLIIIFSYNKQHDYYFSGLLDGTIILISLLGIAFSGILAVIF
jgi:4-hydroxybenzoate polyprenyltransferase